MIRSFSCDNFRNIDCTDLEFSRINIMIGPNNAGKSNFIRALSFAANMINNTQKENTGFLSELKRNGWNSVVNRRRENSQFFLKWNLDLTDEQAVSYKLRAATGSRRELNYITEETLDNLEIKEGYEKPYNFFRCHSEKTGMGEFSTAGMGGVRNKRLRAEINPDESVLLQMDSLFFENKKMFSEKFVRDNIRQVLEMMRKYLKGFFSYSCTSFNLNEIRQMQDEQADGSFMKKDGSNFINAFIYMSEKDAGFEKRYSMLLKRMISDFSEIKIERAMGKVWMELCLKGCWFPLSEVSDGTVNLLLLLFMISQPEQDGISMLAIDEPEMNLHPAWQKLLADEIIRCHGFKQCFISTHSPDFLDEFTEDFLRGDVNIIVFDPWSRNPIRQLDRSGLADELKDWTLGDLYRVADPMIGGWPQ